MAEIVKGIQFGKKKAEQDKSKISTEKVGGTEDSLASDSAKDTQPRAEATSPVSHESQDAPAEDAKYLASRRSELPQLMEHISHARIFLSGLRGVRASAETAALRAEAVQGSSLQNLWESVERSGPTDWQQKPIYYLTLLREFSQNINALLRQERRERRGKPHESASLSEADRLRSDTLYALADSERVVAACKFIDTITNHIFDNIPGFEPETESLRAEKEAFADVSLEELCDDILDSKAADWTARPFFYGAAILELDERTQAIKRKIGEGPVE